MTEVLYPILIGVTLGLLVGGMADAWMEADRG
jgi:hypothetical protein